MTLDKEQLGYDQEDTFADILIHGHSGAGKTYFCATAPGPLYVVTADVMGHKGIPFKVEGKVLKQLTDMQEVVNGFYAGGHGYKTLIVDGLSFTYDMFVKEVGEYFVTNMGAKDADLMPIGGRLKIVNKFKELLRTLAGLTQHPNPDDRVHVIFNTLSESVDNDMARYQLRPLFGSKSMNEVFPAIFSTIGYISPSGKLKEDGTVDETRYTLFTEHKGILARDKLKIFPPMGEAPNLSEILK